MTKARIIAVVAVLLLAGFGCGPKNVPAPPPAANLNVPAKPSSPGLPRQTQQQFDEDDHLDDALKDLETVK